MTQPSGTVTFLFTDIEGSTALAQQHRDQWEALRLRHHAILQPLMLAHDGHIFEIVGDAFCVAFSTPIDALKAAVEAQRALQGEAWTPAPIRVRMGIHTGTAHPSGTDGGYHGYTALARTQRLMAAGHGGQVLVSLPTADLLREEVPAEISLRDMGEQRLKDLVLPERIYQVVVAGLLADFPPLKTLDAFRHNLPAQMTSFIGRERELAEVAHALGKHRLVTVTGPGGAGKTRLALQVAANLVDSFPDGAWFAGLGALTDPSLVPQTVLAAFGLREQPGRSARESLLDHVREKHLLLILDNCEHLLEACLDVSAALLEASPQLHIIATSREPFRLEGEAVWHIPALPLPDLKQLPPLSQLSQYAAVQLFIERAMLVHQDFTVTKENAPAIAQICFHLDGIPLAIELAAARTRSLSPQHIASRLDDRFNVLTGGRRGALPHHQTLRLAFDWSYDLLSQPEQDLLQRLSVFSGGWSLEAAEAMATRMETPLENWLDLQETLVDKSLVSHNPETERYSMLETVQQYAREKLEAGGRLQTCLGAHHAYFVEIADRADREAVENASKEKDWIEALKLELSNLRLALRGLIQRRDADGAMRLAGGLGWFWGKGMGFGEASDWLEQAIALEKGASVVARARARLALGVVRWAQGAFTEGKAFALDSLQVYRAIGNLPNAARSLYIAGICAVSLGQNDEARLLLEEFLELCRQLNNKHGMQYAYNALGGLCQQGGDLISAEQSYLASLSLARQESDRLGEAVLLDNLGNVAYDRRDWAAARAYYEQSTDFWRASNNAWFTAMHLSGLGSVLYHEGQGSRSAQLQGFVQRLCDEVGANLQLAELAASEATAAALKKELGEAAYHRLFEEGKLLSQEQAFALTAKVV